MRKYDIMRMIRMVMNREGRAQSARLSRSRFPASCRLQAGSFRRGFSLTELLLVIAIAAIITAVAAGAFSSAPGAEALDKESAIVLSLLSKARNSTLSGAAPGQFGVHFEATKAVLFSGSSYSSGAVGNSVETMNPLVQIGSISLAGGGSDVVFNRLTGQTAQSGTVTVSLVASSTQSRTITIFGTGLAQSN